MDRHEQIDALAKAIWQRESPAKIYAAIDGLFPESGEHVLDACNERDAAIQDRDVAIERAEKAELERDTLLAALDRVREEPWNRHEIIRGAISKKRPHINTDGQFQSDKYPTCPASKVPLSVKDKTAQDLLWTYAQRRRSVDAEFADDLETCLKAAGYEVETDFLMVPGNEMETDFVIDPVKYPHVTRYGLDFRAFYGELIYLLREARADAVRLIKDVNAEELLKAHRKGQESVINNTRDNQGVPEREVREAAGAAIQRLQAKCETLQRELYADTGIIRSHIELRTKAEHELAHARLIVACAWRVHHGGYIEDAKQDLYRTLVRYAPEGDNYTPRYTDAEIESFTPDPSQEDVPDDRCPGWPVCSEVFRFRITIRDTAGRMLENGKPEPIVVSRGRVFYINDETIEGAAAKLCNVGIQATDRFPASPILLTDFDIAPADESDIPEKAIENWTKARPG